MGPKGVAGVSLLGSYVPPGPPWSLYVVGVHKSSASSTRRTCACHFSGEGGREGDGRTEGGREREKEGGTERGRDLLGGQGVDGARFP
jgi:hypothetical protein